MADEGTISSPSLSPDIPVLETVIKAIFSWVVLMPVAVIVSGHLLAEIFHLSRTDTRQFFRIPIPKFFEIRADGDSVIFGFSAFLITLFLLAAVAGKAIYTLFKMQFGIDPGQFNCLCIFSSLATVLWSATIYLILRNRIITGRSLADEHQKLIGEVAGSRMANGSGGLK